MTSGVVLLIGLAFFGPAQGESRDASASPRERFLREYPAACARLAALYWRDGTGQIIKTTHDKYANGHGYVQVEACQYYIHDGSMRLDVKVLEDRRLDTGGRDGAEGQLGSGKRSHLVARSMVFSASDGRSFAVSQRQPDGPFTLATLKTGSIKALGLHLGPLVEAPIWMMSGRITDQIINGPLCVIDEVSEVESSGRTLVKVRFHFRPHPDDSEPANPPPRGWIQLDPGRGWVMDSNHFVSPNGNSTDHKFHYKSGADEQRFFPESIELKYYNANMSLHGDQITEFRDFEPGPVPDRVFTLAAFGLPDLDAPAAHHGIGTVASWFIGLALLCLVAALALKWYAGRLRRA